jgi:hypothetical protein
VNSISKKKDYNILFTYTFPFGTGVSQNQSSAMSRPFRKLFEKGEDPGKINYVIYKEGDEHYLLGSFANTKKHIIFFPSLIDQRIISQNGQKINQETLPQLDHLTIDIELDKWHFKVLNQNQQIAKFPTMQTKSIDKSLKLWFVWRVKSKKHLETLPKELHWFFPASFSDYKRRVDLTMGSMSKAIHNRIWIPSRPKMKHFLNFEFFISAKKDESYPKCPVFLKSTDIEKENRKKSEGRTIPIQLDEFEGWIFVRVNAIKGDLPIDSEFISGESIAKIT